MKTRTDIQLRLRAVLLLALLLGATTWVAQAVLPPSAILIFTPDAGAKYTVPGPVLIQATSVDPQGTIPHVDFYANDQLIGASDYTSSTPPTSGQSLPHHFTWSHVVVGKYIIVGRGKDSAGHEVASTPVAIEVVEAVTPPPPPPPVNGAALVLVPKGSEWRWLYDGTDPLDAWRATAFDASGWKSGKSQLGFGEGDEATVIWTGKSPYPITAYFRGEFQMPADFVATKLLVKLLRDDGAVVYLNGKEIVRDNMPTGAIHYATLAVGATEGLAFRETSVATDALLVGRNVLAVEMHQYAATSGDLSFDLELDAVPVPLPSPPVVSIVASVPKTSEPAPNIRVAPGQFTVKRTGSTSQSLVVSLAYSGTAGAGVDYQKLPESVEIPAGKSEAVLLVAAIADDLVERDETVIAKLQASSIGSSTMPDTAMVPLLGYTVDPKLGSAQVVIADTTSSSASGKIAIVSPLNGDSFAEGTKITIKATAMDPKGYVSRVEFFDGVTRIGVSELTFIRAPDPGTVIEHSFEWAGATAGYHKLSVSAASSVGTPLTSPPVAITVGAASTLVLASPKAGSEFAWGETIRISAVGALLGGTMTRVEFLDGDNVIGVSELMRGVLWIPGARHEYAIDWVCLVSGQHSLSARSVDGSGQPVRSAPVVITVLPAPLPGVIEVVASTAEATEPAKNAAGKNGAFLVRRVGGPTNVTLTVNYRMSGTASNGVDYARLSGVVTLPKNHGSVEIAVRPLTDSLKEGDETVVLTLLPTVCTKIFPPAPECYELGANFQANGVIHDGKPINLAPKVAITSPKHGSVTTVGNTITVKATASDSDGTIAQLDLISDGVVIATTNHAALSFSWTNAPTGTHKLSAKAVDDEGASSTSSTVTINVRALKTVAFVHRDLPPAYLPGVSLDVTLDATPTKTTSTWAVEETVPAGWLVTTSSDSATFDAAKGLLRFGPFMDANVRKLTYSVTPAADAVGDRKFTGICSLDGKTLAVIGDSTIIMTREFHPADATPADHSITLDELTAYATAWKAGRGWGVDGSAIPLGYLTHAGLIYQKGGKYTFSPAKGVPPECWVPSTGASLAGASGGSMMPGSASRQCPVAWKPGAAGTVNLMVTPPMGSSAMAVSDTVPEGWSVVNVSGGGQFDPATGQVRWGLMFGDAPSKFSYDAVPPADAASNGNFEGEVSFDGMRMPIVGRGMAGAADLATAMRIAGSRRGDAGHVHFTVQSPAEQVFTVEASSDLVNWSEVDAFVFTGEELDVMDPAVEASATRYYRLRPMGR